MLEGSYIEIITYLHNFNVFQAKTPKQKTRVVKPRN